MIRVMGWTIHNQTNLAIIVALVFAGVACDAPIAATPPVATATVTSGTRSPVATRTFSAVQSQLPLPTMVRWAIDKGSPDDPQNRSLLVLFFDGTVQGWRIVDASGGDLFRVPIAGSGIFGPETCVVKARRPNENETWIALDRASVERFSQQYRGYRAIAEGVPVGSATLELVDSGCRGM